MARDENGTVHHWQSDGLPAEVQLEWHNPITLSRIEVKCDSNVKRNIMMRKTPAAHHSKDVPPELLKALVAAVRVDGRWIEVGRVADNRTRLIKLHFPAVRTTAMRLTLTATYGHPNVKLFEVRCYES